MILIDKYVKFLIKHDLSERHFLLLYLVYAKRDDLVGLYKKHHNVEKLITAEDKDVLLKKGFISEDEKGVLVLSKEFLRLFIDKDVATDQIFDIYPVSMTHNGVEIPLKAMDRSVFATLYQNAIMGSIDEHYEVLQDIMFAKQNKLLNIGIEKFIKSKYWLGIRKSRLENKKTLQTKTILDNEF